MNSSHLLCIPKGWVRAGLWVLCLLGLTVGLASSAEPSAAAPSTPTETPAVTLKLLNREIFVFRAAFGPYQPSQRAAAASALIEEARRRSGVPRVSSQVVGTNAEIRIYGQAVFFVTPGDVFAIQGETLPSLVDHTLARLDKVLSEREELRNHRGLMISVAECIGESLLLAGLIWVLASNRRILEGRLIRLTAEKADQLKSHTLRVVGLQNAAPMLRGLMTTVFWLVVAVATFIWLEHLLQLFPHTRPFGEQLSTRFLDLLGQLGDSVVRALPDLGIVFIVWMLARFASTATRRFFTAVGRGHIQSRILDSATAPITQRLCVILIWMTAIIVAFPYIPGSQTPAFRGISVLAGLMISLGSGSVVAQLVGGLILVYNRTCRTGDYVRVGEHEGTLSSIGFFSSRLVNVRNEEIVLPNSQIASGALINYSRLNQTDGVALPVRISIGYNTPWRQVHAMLAEAARRTAGVRQDPAPAVLQTALDDFYVQYQLNAVVENPALRVRALSVLNANIQDVFNEYGVQIMSPHYRSDPPAPVLVPRSKWHEPPAPPAGPG